MFCNLQECYELPGDLECSDILGVPVATHQAFDEFP
jgi:hypothetical protein